MMACPHCGSPLWVLKTKDLARSTLRRRKCFHCGRRIRTLEVPLTERIMALLLDAGVSFPEQR